MADDMIHLGHGSQHLKLDLAGRQKGWGRAAGVIGVSTRTLVGLRVAALSAPVSVTRNGRGQRGTYGGLFRLALSSPSVSLWDRSGPGLFRVPAGYPAGYPAGTRNRPGPDLSQRETEGDESASRKSPPYVPLCPRPFRVTETGADRAATRKPTRVRVLTPMTPAARPHPFCRPARSNFKC